MRIGLKLNLIYIIIKMRNLFNSYNQDTNTVCTIREIKCNFKSASYNHLLQYMPQYFSALSWWDVWCCPEADGSTFFGQTSANIMYRMTQLHLAFQPVQHILSTVPKEGQPWKSLKMMNEILSNSSCMQTIIILLENCPGRPFSKAPRRVKERLPVKVSYITIRRDRLS